MGQSAGQDLADTLRDTPKRVVDTLTLGPQRRNLSKYIDEKRARVRKAVDSFMSSSKTTQKPAQAKRSATLKR